MRSSPQHQNAGLQSLGNTALSPADPNRHCTQLINHQVETINPYAIKHISHSILTLAVKMSIHVLPGDSVPPSVSKNVDVSSFAFLILDSAESTSGAGTFLVLAASLSTFTLSATAYAKPISRKKFLLVA